MTKCKFDFNIDDSTTYVTIPTPRGWKCKRKNCTTDWKHTHSTYLTLATKNESKMSKSRGVLEDMYLSIENSPNKPKFVFFRGIKYRTRSHPFKKALDKWYKTHQKNNQT